MPDDPIVPIAPSPLDFERVSTASRVAEVLRQQLLSGVFPPGTPMRDVELSKRAGVARSTMREALAELARDGLLEHSLHRGMEVARLEQSDVADIYAARRVLERGGVLALREQSEPEYGPLELAVDQMRAAATSEDPRGMVEADTAFHLALVGATRSRRLQQAAQGFLLELRLVLSVLDRGQEHLETQADDHAALLAAIRSDSVARATEAVEQHLVTAQRRLAAALDDELLASSKA